MKIAEKVDVLDGENIWKYTVGDENGEFLVRERGENPNGSKNYWIQSPNGKFYSFFDESRLVTELLSQIIRGEAEDEQYRCFATSIYDDIL